MTHLLNLEKAKNLPDFPSFAKDVINSLEKNGALSIGGWLRTVPTLDLVAISAANKAAMTISPDGNPKLGDLPQSAGHFALLLVDLFSIGEGLDIAQSSLAVTTRFRIFDSYICMELLKRKGFDIRPVYENLSLNDQRDENSDKPIADHTAADCKLGEQIKTVFSGAVGATNLSELLGSRIVDTPLSGNEDSGTQSMGLGEEGDLSDGRYDQGFDDGFDHGYQACLDATEGAPDEGEEG
jgi:hypothetical protein